MRQDGDIEEGFIARKSAMENSYLALLGMTVFFFPRETGEQQGQRGKVAATLEGPRMQGGMWGTRKAQ